jgi:excisionase family DNA binding protein
MSHSTNEPDAQALTATDGGRRDVISAAEVRRRLGIGRNQTYAALARREIPCVRVGRRFLIPRMAFEEFLKAKA